MIYRSLLALAVLLLCAAAQTEPIHAQSGQGAIRLGVILPLSGQYARFGEDARKAVEMALAGLPFKLFFEDSRFQASQALTAYIKLRERNHIDALINLDSVSFKALHPLILRDGILTFQLAESVSHKDDTVFQIMPSSFPLYAKLGELAGERYKKVALVYGGSEFLLLDAEHFKRGISKEKVIFEQMLPSSPDYRSLVTRLLGAKPAAATFFLNVEDGIALLRALKEQGGLQRLELICDANTELNISQYVKALGAETFEGCISVSLPDRMTEDFRRRFRERYGEEPGMFSDYAYDAASLLKLLVNEPKKSWKTFVANQNLKGASGEVVFDELGTRRSDFEVRIFKNGKFHKLERNAGKSWSRPT